MKAYRHGGDIKSFAQKTGCREDEVIDLSSNINFVKPTLNINFNTIDISAYPDYSSLYKAISTLYKVHHSNIELFNGGSVAIHTLFKFLKLKHCTLYSPLYSEYKKAAMLNGYKISLVNRLKESRHNIEPKSLIIFVNPSTPDGKFYNIDKLMKKWMKKECTIIIDESFLDFTPFESAIKYLKTYSKLYILKSMTKFYGAAGIRIGTVLSQVNTIEKLQKQEPIWKISQFDSYYLQAALKDKDFPRKSEIVNKTNKKYLIDILENCSYIERVYSSNTNFVLLKLKQIDGKLFQKKLAIDKIMVRECENFDFLNDSYIRIAVKDMASLKILERTLCTTFI